MITYGDTNGAKEMKFPGLGWVLVKTTEFGTFRIVALAKDSTWTKTADGEFLKSPSEGWKTRDEARKAKVALKR